MRRRSGAWIIAPALGAVVAVGPMGAAARSTSTLPYPSGEVWAAAVRFLRVDRGLPIREKDEAAGYVLFDYSEGGKSYKAALELVPFTDEDGRVTTQASLTIAGLPKRYEGALLEGLGAKIRDERGPPPAAKRPARGDAADKERSRDPKEKDRERDGAKASGPPDAGGLPRIPTLPLR
jgi:hypothetical protein